MFEAKKQNLEYLSLGQASKYSGYSSGYLRSLINQGKLRAEKKGQKWLTTKAWMDNCRTTKTQDSQKAMKTAAIQKLAPQTLQTAEMPSVQQKNVKMPPSAETPILQKATLRAVKEEEIDKKEIVRRDFRPAFIKARRLRPAIAVILLVIAFSGLALAYPFYQPRIKPMADKISSLLKTGVAFLNAELTEPGRGYAVAEAEDPSLGKLALQLVQAPQQTLNNLSKSKEEQGLLSITTSEEQGGTGPLAYQSTENTNQVNSTQVNSTQSAGPVKEIIKEKIIVKVDDEELARLKKELALIKKELEKINKTAPKEIIKETVVTTIDSNDLQQLKQDVSSLKQQVNSLSQTEEGGIIKEVITTSITTVDNQAVEELQAQFDELRKDYPPIDSPNARFYPLQVVQSYEDLILETDPGAGHIWITSAQNLFLTSDKIVLQPYNDIDPVIVLDSPTEIRNKLTVNLPDSESSLLLDLQYGGQTQLTIDKEGNLISQGRLSSLKGLSASFTSYVGQAATSIAALAQELPEQERVVMFWNDQNQQMELYLIEEDRFIPLTIKEATTTEATTTQISIIDNLELKQALQNLGLEISQEGTLTVGAIKAKKAVLEELELVDKATGEIYCTWLENGEWQKEKGECQTGSGNNQDGDGLDTVIVSHPDQETTSTDAVFQFEAINLAASSTANFQCNVNSQGFLPCQSPKTYPGLTKGNYTFEVYAVEENGTYDETPAIFTWTISEISTSTDQTTTTTDETNANPEPPGEEPNQGQATSTDQSNPEENSQQSATSTEAATSTDTS